VIEGRYSVSNAETLRVDFRAFSRAAALIRILPGFPKDSGVDVKPGSQLIAVTRRRHPFVEWLYLTWFLCGWAAREHHLTLQAMGLVPVESRERGARCSLQTSRIR
jgi:hypothetical protein